VRGGRRAIAVLASLTAASLFLLWLSSDGWRVVEGEAPTASSKREFDSPGVASIEASESLVRSERTAEPGAGPAPILESPGGDAVGFYWLELDPVPRLDQVEVEVFAQFSDRLDKAVRCEPGQWAVAVEGQLDGAVVGRRPDRSEVLGWLVRLGPAAEVRVEDARAAHVRVAMPDLGLVALSALGIPDGVDWAFTGSPSIEARDGLRPLGLVEREGWTAAQYGRELDVEGAERATLVLQEFAVPERGSAGRLAVAYPSGASIDVGAWSTRVVFDPESASVQAPSAVVFRGSRMRDLLRVQGSLSRGDFVVVWSRGEDASELGHEVERDAAAVDIPLADGQLEAWQSEAELGAALIRVDGSIAQSRVEGVRDGHPRVEFSLDSAVPPFVFDASRIGDVVGAHVVHVDGARPAASNVGAGLLAPWFDRILVEENGEVRVTTLDSDGRAIVVAGTRGFLVAKSRTDITEITTTERWLRPDAIRGRAFQRWALIATVQGVDIEIGSGADGIAELLGRSFWIAPEVDYRLILISADSKVTVIREGLF
jgi:hypothetical protein